VLVELGYDRSIPPWEPTPARLIPPLNPGKVAGNLVNAIGEGINNAAALVGLPGPSSAAHVAARAPVSPVPSRADADISAKRTVSGAVAQPNSSASTATASTEPAAQQNTVATASTPRQPKPAGGPVARRLAGQQTQDVDVPRKRRSTTAGSGADGAPRVRSTSSPKPDGKPDGSSTPDSSASSTSPDGTDP
jgi:hypothetical protein